MSESRTSRRLLGVGLTLLLLLAVVVVGLHLPFVLSFVRGQVVDITNASLRGKLEIDEISGSPFTELTLHGVRLRAPDGEQVVAIDELQARIELSELLGLGVQVQAEARGANVFLRRDAEGNLNLNEVLPEPTDEPTTPLPVWLDLHIDVESASAVWRDDAVEAVDDDPLAAVDASTPADERQALASKVVEPGGPLRAPPHTILADQLDASVRVIVTREQQTAVRVKGVRLKFTATELGPTRDLTIDELALDVSTDGDLNVNLASLDVGGLLTLGTVNLDFPTKLENLAADVRGLSLTTELFDRVAPEARLLKPIIVDAALAPSGAQSVVVARVAPEGHAPVELAGTVAGWVDGESELAWTAKIHVPALAIDELTAIEQPVKRLGMSMAVEGTGAAPDTLSARARVAVHSVDVDRYRVESAFLSGSFVDQTLRLDRALVQTPYASASTQLEFGLGSGDFRIRAQAEATDAVAELARDLFGRQISTRADIGVNAEGNIDLARSEPSEMLRRLSADVDWDIRDFVAEDVQVKESRGDVTASLDTVDGTTNFELDGRLSGRSIRGAGASLGSMAASFRASSRAQTADPVPMDILKRLQARVDLDVNGLIASGSLVRDVDLLLTVAPSGNRLRYDLRGSAARISAGSIRVRDAATKLKGSLALGDSLSWPAALKAVAVKGNASARGVDASGDAATTVNADIDVAGPLSDLRGSVNARTTGLQVADYAFTTLGANVKFVGDRIFEVDADGKQANRKPEDLGVYIRARHNRELTDYEVLELRFSSTGDSWNLSEGFSFDTQRGSITFDDVTLERGDQRINLKGTFRQGQDQDLAVDVDRVELASIIADLGLEELAPLRGRVSAEAELAGTSGEPTARFSIHLEDLYWEEYGPFELLAEGRYGERKLVVESLELDGYGVRIVEGNATLPIAVDMTGVFEVLQGDPLEVFLDTPTLDPEKLWSAIPALNSSRIRGEVGMTTKIRGTLRSPRLNTDVRVDKLFASPLWEDDRRFDVGPIHAALGVRYSSPKSENGGFEVSLNGRLADEPPVQVLARIEADVASWLRESLDGNEVDWLDRAQQARWRFIGKAQKFDLRNVRFGPLREADIEGRLTLNIIGDGTFAAPTANFEIHLEDFGWERYRDVYFDADLAVETTQLRLKSSRLEWDADEIATASGTIPVPFESIFGDAPLGRMPIDFEIRLARTRLNKLSAVDYSFASLKGDAGGFITLGGTLRKPVIETHLGLEGVEFADRTTGGFDLDAALTGDGAASARIQWKRDGKPTLRATADLPLDLNLVKFAEGEELDLDGPFSAELTGTKVPIAGLIPRRVFDSVVRDVAGRLDASLKVGGTITRPTFDGRLRVADAKLTLTEYARTFTDVQFDATGDPAGKLTLHDLHVEGEQGYIDAQGTLAHQGWQPGVVDGKIEVREFGTTGFTDLAIFVTADTRLGGDFAATPATATATISGVEVVMPDSVDQNALPTALDQDIVVIRTERDREALFAVAGNIEPVSTDPFLELGIRIERGARVRHPLAQVELEGDLDLRLSEAGPMLFGEVNAYRGRAQVLDKEFSVQQGLVTFTGNDPPDPRLQLEAAHTLDERVTNELGQPTSGEPRAIVRITGRLSDSQIRFRSDPSMPESDVIYVLMTGRLPGQGGVGETGIAAGAASGLLTNLIAESPVGRILDVRVEAGDEGLSDASIEVGRYIGRDVFISLDIKSSPKPDENTSELNIEYRFAPRWIFEFEAGDRATGEVNIFWDIL